MSNVCPSGVGVKGEAEGEKGRGEVCGTEFTSDAENQESPTPDAVAETETGRSLWVTWGRWEWEEDKKGEIVLLDCRGRSRDRPSERPPGIEWGESSIPTLEAEGALTLEDSSSKLDESQAEDGSGT